MDKSSYSNSQHNQPLISQGLQDFISAMVEEVVLEGGSFEKSKKWLQKYSENESLDYEKIVAGFDKIFELFIEYKEIITLNCELQQWRELEKIASDDPYSNIETIQKRKKEILDKIKIKKSVFLPKLLMHFTGFIKK